MTTYTSYEVLRRRKGGPVDRCSRRETALRFKAMYRSLGMDLPACAKFLQVTERTLHNWESGRHVIPFSAYKLLRLLNRMELPGSSWAGWCFQGGKLISPEGHLFDGQSSGWWSSLVRRAALFDQLYKENASLRMRLADLQSAAAKRAMGAPLAGGLDRLAPAQAPISAQSKQLPKSNFSTGCVWSHEVPPMVITGRTYQIWGRVGAKMGS